MKKYGRKLLMGVICSAALMLSQPFSVMATESGEAVDTHIAEVYEDQVLRNSVFTTQDIMAEMTGNSDPDAWSVGYLSDVERVYWNFTASGEHEQKLITKNVLINAYQNLEMFLDNGYLYDYNELKAYTERYLALKEGVPDAFYLILTNSLSSPYLMNKPEAECTDFTYNGRDYSAVFDPEYYYDHNEDLQVEIGYNPPELLRHFVEVGINQGRRGNAAFDIQAYINEVDAEIAAQRSGLTALGNAPIVTKYSYSYANYYGKYLGHYDFQDVFGSSETEEEY